MKFNKILSKTTQNTPQTLVFSKIWQTNIGFFEKKTWPGEVEKMIFMKKYLFLDIWILFKLALFKQFILVLYELREKNKHFTWNLAKYYQRSVWDEHFLDDCWWFFPYRSQDLLDFSWFWSTLSKDISELDNIFRWFF